jgi:hypothetical protein
MSRWTVQFGEDVILVERLPDGTVVVDIPSRRSVRSDRAAVEDLRLKLGAAISNGGDSHD